MAYNPYVQVSTWQNNPYYQEWMAKNTNDYQNFQNSFEYQGEQNKPNTTGQKAVNAVGIGLQNYEAAKANTPSFSIDPYAGYMGSAEGFMSGGTYGAIAGGIGSQIGQFQQVNDNLGNLSTSVNAYDTINGNPYYKGGAVLEAMSKLKALDEGAASLETDNPLGEWGQTFTGLGMADPSTQIFNNLFGTSDKIARKQKQLKKQLVQGQQGYNTAETDYQRQQRAMSDYYKRSNPYRRQTNLYQ